MEPGKLRDLFEKVQKVYKKSPKSLQKYLNVKKSMFYKYKSEEHLMPFEIFKKLIKLANKRNLDLDFNIYEISNVENHPKLPKLCENLSEFIGALAGDGYIGENEVCVIGHGVLDKFYIKEHLEKLCISLFELTPKYYTKPNYIKLKICSRKLKKHLVEKYNLPNGKKKGKLKIPKQMTSSLA